MFKYEVDVEVGDILVGKLIVDCEFCSRETTKSKIKGFRCTEDGFIHRFYLNPIDCPNGHDRWDLNGNRLNDFKKVKRARTLKFYTLFRGPYE